MRFGKFLTQTGIVSATEVLAALAEQSRRRAYLPMMLAASGMAPADLTLECSSSASGNDEELLVELYRRGFLNARDYQRVEQQWRGSAPPLGEILVEQGLLSESELAAHLEAFRASVKSGNPASVAARSS
jgi:hypothetical protein